MYVPTVSTDAPKAGINLTLIYDTCPCRQWLDIDKPEALEKAEQSFTLCQDGVTESHSGTL